MSVTRDAGQRTWTSVEGGRLGGPAQPRSLLHPRTEVGADGLQRPGASPGEADKMILPQNRPQRSQPGHALVLVCEALSGGPGHAAKPPPTGPWAGEASVGRATKL